MNRARGFEGPQAVLVPRQAPEFLQSPALLFLIAGQGFVLDLEDMPRA